jgi:hypothetical protein
MQMINYVTTPRHRNQNELLRVLCASKASTQRSRRVSLTSVFGVLPGTEDTEKKNLRETTPSQELVLQNTRLLGLPRPCP